VKVSNHLGKAKAQKKQAASSNTASTLEIMEASTPETSVAITDALLHIPEYLIIKLCLHYIDQSVNSG